ncbi:MAG: Lrp/AsnC family transcriptional regulator [Leptolyngbyaceae cyanobacterium bins.302]|nr:Lrp/AsnC family transcriptional regulator [Leptolyngbyaceae cyanobacterium bins.302]
MVTDNQSQHSNHLKLDELDTKIVQFLQKDGRMPYTDIAKQVGVAEATIRYRVQRLLESGAITIQANLNLEKLEHRNIAAIALLINNPGLVDQIASELCSLDEVSYVVFVTGRYNLVVEIVHDSYEDLQKFLLRLQHIPGLLGFEVQTVIKLYKTQDFLKLKLKQE